MTRTVLIAGATGLVGKAAMEHFASLDDWNVVAISRRVPELPPGVAHVALDLTDRDACLAARPQLADVSHVVFAALYEIPGDLVAGWRNAQQMQINRAMIGNLFDTLDEGSLEHFSVLQGTKAYGIHVEPMAAPAKERWPRHAHENFYWLQEDFLRERQAGRAWSFTVLRPQAVLGHAVGSPMNVIAAIGCHAAILKAEDKPLRFTAEGDRVTQATDSRLLAAAFEWAATNPAAAGETFNVTNGDILIWRNLYPSVARFFDMELAEPALTDLAVEMPKHAATWDRIVRESNLHAPALDALVGDSWEFTDRSFGRGDPYPPVSVVSSIKLRQAGFHDCMDTEDSVLYWLERMRRERFLP